MQNGSKEAGERTIEVLYVPQNPKARLEAIRKGIKNLSLLGLRSRREQRILTGDEFERRYKSARMFLDWMAADLEVRPDMKQRVGLDQSLEMVYSVQDMHFPDDIRDKARALYQRFTEENWGAAAVLDEESDDDEQQQQAAATADGETPTAQIALPSRNDPFFGRGGMMYGVLRTRGARGGIVWIVDPRVPKINAKVYGHNGIAPGTWYALQIVALARGAHGAKMAGIAGHTTLGAYSIVVSSSYADLDRDHGDTLFYSGSNSHKNDDPTRPAPSRPGTNALKASRRTGNPVRVLRAAGAGAGAHAGSRNKWAPDRGIRYDGLYRVVRMLTPTNNNGMLVVVLFFSCPRIPNKFLSIFSL
ncbi:hypothetical protein SLS62_006980 [Diatrype stigma]|uniref:YDG domain-containing protein n=1 Tax=Diatrype stigma TaxID=117547 RepID=A0AAN9URU0_9PEZI